MFIASYLANETALPTINLLHLSSRKALTAALQMAQVFPHIDFRREVTIGHLVLDTNSKAGVLAKVNPPIRPREDVEFLWQKVLEGKVDWVVSDHACCRHETKVAKNALRQHLARQVRLRRHRHVAGRELGGRRVCAAGTVHLRASSAATTTAARSASTPRSAATIRSASPAPSRATRSRAPAAMARRCASGGLQYQRNFGTAPLLITYPSADVAGTAVVPSTVDVFIGNAKAYSTPGQARPVLGAEPARSGRRRQRAGGRCATVFGKESTAVVPYVRYDSMLKQGLHDFSYEAGYLRRNYAIESNDYGDFAAVGTHRYGVTELADASRGMQKPWPTAAIWAAWSRSRCRCSAWRASAGP